MVFSGLIFIFGFLPLVLLGYHLLPVKYRHIFLFGANLLFYGWAEPVFIFIMIASALVNFTFGRMIGKYAHRAKVLLGLGICADLGLLFFFKYAVFCREIVASLFGFSIGAGFAPALPVGISFYTFQAVSYLVDVYRGDIKAEKSPLLFGVYLSFFPQLIAGPIVRYSEMRAALLRRAATAKQFREGVEIFLVGLGKKVLIANEMGALFRHLQPLAAEAGWVCAWGGMIAFAFQIYFDFSGYSDMARGLGKMFGFELPFNFRYPYSATSLTDFWRRWHMTLTRWFRDYLYIPLGGNRRGLVRTVFNLFLVWTLTGLWHGAAYNFAFWGFFWFCCLVGEKYVWGKVLAVMPSLLKRGYTLVIIAISWVFFSIDDPGGIAGYLQGMFSLGDAPLRHDAVVYIVSYLPLLIVAAVASQEKVAVACRRLLRWYGGTLAMRIFLFLVFLLSVAALVDQSYNPFLYFRF